MNGEEMSETETFGNDKNCFYVCVCVCECLYLPHVYNVYFLNMVKLNITEVKWMVVWLNKMWSSCCLKKEKKKVKVKKTS